MNHFGHVLGSLPHRLHNCFTVLLCFFFSHTALFDAAFAFSCSCQGVGGVGGCGGSGNNPLYPTMPSTALMMILSIIYKQARLRRQSLFEHP